MKRIIAFMALFLVFGCSTKPASVSVTETAKESISAISKALPKECQTESIQAQLAVLDKLVDTQLKVCETEKHNLEVEKSKKDLIIVILGLIIVGYFGLKLYKKF